MAKRVTVYYDLGTSNLRLFLLDASLNLIDKSQQVIGAKDSAISGSNKIILEHMYSLYKAILEKHNFQDENVEDIYVSGMATSPYGIHEVPHFETPTTSDQFALKAVTPYTEAEFFKRTIHLVAGLKSIGADISSTHNVRGEEIEVIGALKVVEELFPNQQVAVILPGSHTHTLLAGQGRIEGIVSCFTGELYHALQMQTILSPILSTPLDAPLEDAVKLAMENLSKYGFNRAIYIGHAMRVFDENSAQFRRSYCDGVISGGVIQALDYQCKTYWKQCDSALILANPYITQLFTTMLKCSDRIKVSKTAVLPSNNTFALEGMRTIINIRKEQL